jgi:hypothetical protein
MGTYLPVPVYLYDISHIPAVVASDTVGDSIPTALMYGQYPATPSTPTSLSDAPPLHALLRTPRSQLRTVHKTAPATGSAAFHHKPSQTQGQTRRHT